jgi:hypothetical protein
VEDKMEDKMEDMICIIGCGHSGTSLFRKIIGNHKDIYCIPNETSLFKKTPNEIKRELDKYDRYRKNENKRYICEKTPKHVEEIDKIYKFIKNPKIIVVIRDGRDVFSSLNKRNSNTGENLLRWINDNNSWLNHPKKDEFHVVRYEDLIKNKENVIYNICSFLQIEYTDEMFNYEKKNITLPENFFSGLIKDTKHSKLREYQLNQPIYDGTKRWMTDLSELDLEKLYENPDFVNIMIKLGYQLDLI